MEALKGRVKITRAQHGLETHLLSALTGPKVQKNVENHR